MKDWNKIVLSYTFISAFYMNIVCCREEEVQKITHCQSIEHLIQNSLFHIHKDMYLQAPKEGAWMQCCITIEKGNSYDISFNYDDITSIPDIFTFIVVCARISRSLRKDCSGRSFSLFR